MKPPMYTRHGFTVVELAVAIIVIGILTSIVMVSYRTIQYDADTKEIEGDLRQASLKLDSYKANNGAFPVTQADVGDGAGLPKSNDERSYSYVRIAPDEYCLSMASTRYDTVLHIATDKVNNSVTLAPGAC